MIASMHGTDQRGERVAAARDQSKPLQSVFVASACSTLQPFQQLEQGERFEMGTTLVEPWCEMGANVWVMIRAGSAVKHVVGADGVYDALDGAVVGGL
jgi:hypothetical protein